MFGKFVLALALFVSCSQIYGQVVYGTIYGTVTDPTGAAVPQAKVTITDLDRQGHN
ncbi:MAG: carboxypeptidase-like regulatory domain-containing protein [Bryobacteraceae bacterium]|nr:carboxypeptidase-like regulatory domain-containing protein [Bryobacteraceae bacterium]MDW8377517.1 carboxypeptidase-like regulatory domain-containing protein [Bryobacterales bacterium]